MNQRRGCWRSNLWIALGVMVIVALVYAPVVGFEFVNWDDDLHLLDNPFVQSLDREHLRAIFSTTVNQVYSPLSQLSFAVDKHIFGLNPAVYHLNNLLLHLVVTGLIVFFARGLGLSGAAAAVAALIFGLHPMHVESVAWVTERKDGLYAVFYLLAMLVYLRYARLSMAGERGEGDRPPLRPTARLGYLLAIVLLAVLSALSKAMALSLPFILLLLDWYLRRRISARVLFEKFVVGTAIFPIIWVSYIAHIGTSRPHSWPGVLTWVWCLIFHLQKFLVPDKFYILYSFPGRDSVAYVYAAGLLSFLVGVLILARRQRLLIFAMAYYLASIFFLLRADPTVEWIHPVADRFMYLPSLGLCLWLGAAVDYAFHRYPGPVRFVLILGLGLIGAALLAQTRSQVLVWRDSRALWRHQLLLMSEREGLQAAIAYAKYADALTPAGDFYPGLDRLRPYGSAETDLRSDACLGQEDPAAQRLRQVITLYEASLSARPGYVHANYGLARIYARLGEGERAAGLLSTVLRNDPGHFEAAFLLGQVFQSEGRAREAAAAYEQALRSYPDRAIMCRRVQSQLDCAAGPGARAVSAEIRRVLLPGCTAVASGL